MSVQLRLEGLGAGVTVADLVAVGEAAGEAYRRRLFDGSSLRGVIAGLADIAEPGPVSLVLWLTILAHGL